MRSSTTSFHFAEPAERWYDALPLGNGSIGAMVFGDVREERIRLSEGTFWSGEPAQEAAGGNCVDGRAIVDEVRRELFDGSADALRRAHELARTIEGSKLNYGTNLPFGNLRISGPLSFGEVGGYSRLLDMDAAVVRVSFSHGGARYTREAFVSHVDQVLVTRLSCSEPGRLTVRISVDGDEQPCSVRCEDRSRIAITALAHELVHSDGRTGVTGEGVVHVRATGAARVTPQGDQLFVESADSVEILMAIATSFNGADGATECRRRIDAAAARTYDQLMADHCEDHRSLFRRSGLALGTGREQTGAAVALDRLVTRAIDGDGDPALFELLFNFGRYLLIGSSRPDSSLPAHLLGVWNDNVACRIGWTCDYHLDINTQMNYWISELTNLPECTLPLFRWIEERLVPSGRVTAQRLYGSPGWVAHIVSNAWGYSAPGWSTWWGFHITGGVWVALHLWDHYAFSCDTEFLRDHAYPVLSEAARFFVDHLTEHPELGYLVTGPTCSPETGYLVDGQVFTLTTGATVDGIMLRELFAACISAQEVLGVSEAWSADLAGMADRLPPLRPGANGRLMEWLHDYDEALPHHRHTSHLLSVFPFSQITPDGTPELAEAARQSIAGRLQAPRGFEEGAWARNLLTAYHARLGDSAGAYESLLDLFRRNGDRSLMAGASIAPMGAYEMDYNTGATASIVEMLVQSRNDRILILPALPAEWPEGSAWGLCARGGFVVDLEWREGRLTRVSVLSRSGGRCVVTVPGISADVEIDTVAGERYEILEASR